MMIVRKMVAVLKMVVVPEMVRMLRVGQRARMCWQMMEGSWVGKRG